MFIVRCKDGALKFSDVLPTPNKEYVGIYEINKGTAISVIEQWVNKGYKHILVREV